LLSLSRKESILRRRGVCVAPFPERALPFQERFFERGIRKPQEEVDADAALALAAAAWRERIEQMYASLMRGARIGA